MNIVKFALLLVILFEIITSAPVKRKRYCPNNHYCDCDFESKRIECLCQLDDCKHNRTVFNFANKNLTMFKDVYINNIDKIDASLFEYSTFMQDFRLSLQSVKYMDSYMMAFVNKLKYLEIIYDDLVEIKKHAFDRLECDTLSLISFGKNFQLNLNAFGPQTYLNNLVLDYHSSNFISQLFYINETYSIKNEEDLIRHWSSNATIKRIFIQEAKGIKTLDETWIPKFRFLNTIEIIFSDIDKISESFIMLHSNTLMYLTIRQSKIEVLEANLFEKFKVLEYLDLGSNPLKVFDIKSFNGLNLLNTLKLESISDSYIFDNEDICLLSFLPCGLDVYLDNYDESVISCAIIYLHELKNDTEKFKSTIGSIYFSQLDQHTINYMRDQDCKLKERIKNCLKVTNRNTHCLYPNEIFNFDENEINANLIADVELVLNKKLVIGDINMTLDDDNNDDEKIIKQNHKIVNWNYLGNRKSHKYNNENLINLNTKTTTNIDLNKNNLEFDEIDTTLIFIETSTAENIPINTKTTETSTEKTTIQTISSTSTSTSIKTTKSTSLTSVTNPKLTTKTISLVTTNSKSTIRDIKTSTMIYNLTDEISKSNVSFTYKTTPFDNKSILVTKKIDKYLTSTYSSSKTTKSSLGNELLNSTNQNFQSSNTKISPFYQSHNFSFQQQNISSISLKNLTTTATTSTLKENKVYNFPLKYLNFLNKSLINNYDNKNDNNTLLKFDDIKKNFAIIVTKSAAAAAATEDISTPSFIDLTNSPSKSIKYSDFLIIIILSLIVVGLLQFSVGCFAFYIFYTNMKSKIGLVNAKTTKNNTCPVEPKNFTQKYEISSHMNDIIKNNSNLDESLNQSIISNSFNYQPRKLSTTQKPFMISANKLNENRLIRHPSHSSYDQSRLFARPSIERI